MTPTPRIRRKWSLPLVAGMLCGLIAWPAVPAAADDYVPNPPTLKSLRLEGTNATVTFTDNTEPDLSFSITLTERDNPGYTTITRKLPGTTVPGVGRSVTRTASGAVKPGIAYCATVEAVVKYKDEPLNAIPLEDPSTGPSNKVCAQPTDTANPAGSPTDLSMDSISGPADVTVGAIPNYWVSYANSGPAVSAITIEVLTSGPLALRLAPPSGPFNGFQCAAVGPSGGSTGGFRCTGGTLKAGEKGRIPLLTSVTKKGFGAVHATISVAGDTNSGNNSATYTVQAQ